MGCRSQWAAGVLVAASTVAHAQDAGPCRVTDPTGTPLNVRTQPDGVVVGLLQNEEQVVVTDNVMDRNGRAWAFVVESDTHAPLGWVFRSFITCR